MEKRNGSEVLKHGTLETWYDKRVPGVAAYRRILEGKTLAVVANITTQSQEYEIPDSWRTGGGLINLWTGKPFEGGSSVELEPYGWMILEGRD